MLSEVKGGEKLNPDTVIKYILATTAFLLEKPGSANGQLFLLGK